MYFEAEGFPSTSLARRLTIEKEDEMSIESLREIVANLSASAGALSVLGAELSARTSGTAIHPRLRSHVDEVLQAIGATAALEGLSPEELRPLWFEILHFVQLDNALLAHPDRAPGWTHADNELLQTGGDVTAGFAQVLPRIAPMLEGLSSRLDGGNGSFLDVGTGVAKLAIGMARRWPSLRVVGIDVWAPSLTLARSNVAAANLQGRIELREQNAEALPDEAAFDLAWIPAPFIPPHAIQRVVERVHRALKPGGWMLFATAKPGGDLQAALMRLRVSTFGGQISDQQDVEKLLAAAGYTQITPLPGPPRDFKMIVAARRAPRP